MKQFRCQNCGGYINPSTYRCEYCGTQYEKPWDVFNKEIVYVQRQPSPTNTYGVSLTLPDYYAKEIDEEEIRERLAIEMTDAIKNNLEVYADHDIVNMSIKYSARIRILKPEFRWR